MSCTWCAVCESYCLLLLLIDVHVAGAGSVGTAAPIALFIQQAKRVWSDTIYLVISFVGCEELAVLLGTDYPNVRFFFFLRCRT